MRTTSARLQSYATISWREWLFVAVCFAVLACVFVLVMSPSTSFLYHHPEVHDSAIFQVTGQRWLKGDLPYVDFWDLKGPYVFAVNALGYALHDSPRGVMLVQMAFLVASLLLLWRFFRDTFSIRSSSMLVGCVVVMLMQMECDNNVEIYVLPFLIVAFRGLYRWVDCYDGQLTRKHPPQMAVFYGACLALCLLNRLTDATGIGLGVLFVAMMLAARRQWADLLLNGCCFVCGMMLLLVPVWIYFHAHGAVGEWLDATMVTAAEYATNSTPLKAAGLGGAVNFVKAFFPCYALVTVAALVFVKSQSRRLQAALWLFVAGGQLIWFLNSNRYAHYALVTVPYVCVIAAELKRYIQDHHPKKWVVNGVAATGFAFFLMCFVHESLQAWHEMHSESPRYAIYEKMMHLIPANERQQVAIYNGAPCFYLYFNNHPPCRYLVMNDLTIAQMPSLKDHICEDLEKRQPLWMIVEGFPTQIDDCLMRFYVLHAMMENQHLKLYRLKNVKE